VTGYDEHDRRFVGEGVVTARALVTYRRLRSLTSARPAVETNPSGEQVLAWYSEPKPLRFRVRLVGAFRTRAGGVREIQALATGVEFRFMDRNEMLPMARGRTTIPFLRLGEVFAARGTAPSG
jgi:hypothetical protein